MNKPAKTYPRPVRDFVARCLGTTFAKQGFASSEIVTRWADIVGADIAAHAEPLKLQWPRGDRDAPEPGTLVIKVEGPVAIEIQHQSGVIVERVNRFFGWRAISRISIRQAPLGRPARPAPPPSPDPARVAGVAAEIGGIADEGLHAALARLGAAIKAP